ncbi:MAG: amino acid-binding protein [Gammaproteobacteria bacterium]|nr:amino acid-binding protein [Gammaproteobacteria bacterium]MCY4217990.1 amino acid-binding protein [Gammaproteobacteria bacterium]MCY4274321.1 amino acid-binding protein [Gammaproteobacteria bacterium]
MKIIKNRLSALLLSISMMLIGAVHAADVVIGSPNWASVQATAHVLKVVLEDNLGLEVEIQNGTNPIVFEAMDKGTMHVHPEVWLPNQANLHQTYVVDKATVAMNPNGVTSFQGMCVSKQTADSLGVSSITDLTNPEIAKQFDSNGDGKGEIWIGATGWASTNVEKIRAKSYGYDQTLELSEMDETLALANLDAAIAQNKPFVFFCYTPHHMFALHDLVVLKEPAFDESKWVVYQPTDDPNWLENSSAPVAWKDANLHIHYAKSLEESQPEAAAILNKVKFTTDQVSQMVYAVSVQKMAHEDVARNWVDENSATVDEWLK